jgi:hypothetical protein
MRCRRCNRILKNATENIGPICKKKEAFGVSVQNDSDSDIIVPYDGGDIWIERLGNLSDGDDGRTYVVTHSCSGIRTNIQRIEYRHSPTGFNFGYGGSGPADTALNILRMFTTKEIADANYQSFKFLYLTKQGDRLEIPKQEILNFIEQCHL